jgi:hypothetical protein
MPENEVQKIQEGTLKRTREKSVRYPYYSLKECVEYLTIVHEIAGKKEAPIETILTKLKIISPDNKRYKYLTSSSEIFNLIEKTKVGIKPTEMGTLILYPPRGEAQRRELLIEAFKAPLLYQKILEKYNQMTLPDFEILKNVFYNLGIAKIVLDNAVNAFIESAQYVNVLDSNNRLYIEALAEDKNAIQSQSPQPNIHPPFVGGGQKPSDITGFDKIEITTTSGKKASILLPSDSSKEDIDKLIKLLKVYNPE